MYSHRRTSCQCTLFTSVQHLSHDPQKFVSTTLRPTAAEHPELYHWRGCASFVADFLSLKPLESPVSLVRMATVDALPFPPPPVSVCAVSAPAALRSLYGAAESTRHMFRGGHAAVQPADWRRLRGLLCERLRQQGDV